MLLVLRFPTNRMQKAPLGSLLPLVRRVGFASRSAELETFAPSSRAAASGSNPDAKHKKRLVGDAFCIRCAGLDSNQRRPKSIGLQPIPFDRLGTDAVRILCTNGAFCARASAAAAFGPFADIEGEVPFSVGSRLRVKIY